jgi:hypothetical protein
MLLDKCIDALPVVSTVSNLQWMLTSTDMIAGSLGDPLPIHIEDFCLAECNAFGRLFANHAHKSRSRWHNAREREKIFSETFKFRVVDLKGTMHRLR